MLAIYFAARLAYRIACRTWNVLRTVDPKDLD